MNVKGPSGLLGRWEPPRQGVAQGCGCTLLAAAARRIANGVPKHLNLCLYAYLKQPEATDQERYA